ncbi:insertion element hypothetical protein [Salipiger pallidus]|uniref:Integrase catalytic domain-containing protein n=1 Tax=Salipiger pallidus TaxID=1775170 RepID=A0A8J2ZI67_9RHOB|nr:integrase core domain-containing protein [Salipiger pallidus]GGG65419.1 insertion element hypothetical protein [Salipiger pallidus]
MPGFGIPRRTVYYKPVKSAPMVEARFSEPIKKLIEEEPSFGYRTVAWLLEFNKNTMQRIFQIKGWPLSAACCACACRATGAQACRGMRPRIQAVPSVAAAPNERWSTDLARIWMDKDGWASLAFVSETVPWTVSRPSSVIDCHTSKLLGWHLSKSGKATTASAALEHALIARFGTLSKVEEEFLLRSDNGLIFTSHHFTRIARSYGLKQAFITPHCPQQNDMVEHFIRTLKKQCVHRHRFETIQHAMRVIGDWISFYNNRRPHRALAMRTPA